MHTIPPDGSGSEGPPSSRAITPFDLVSYGVFLLQTLIIAPRLSDDDAERREDEPQRDVAIAVWLPYIQSERLASGTGIATVVLAMCPISRIESWHRAAVDGRICNGSEIGVVSGVASRARLQGMSRAVRDTIPGKVSCQIRS